MEQVSIESCWHRIWVANYPRNFSYHKYDSKLPGQQKHKLVFSGRSFCCTMKVFYGMKKYWYFLNRNRKLAGDICSTFPYSCLTSCKYEQWQLKYLQLKFIALVISFLLFYKKINSIKLKNKKSSFYNFFEMIFCSCNCSSIQPSEKKFLMIFESL